MGQGKLWLREGRGSAEQTAQVDGNELRIPWLYCNRGQALGLGSRDYRVSTKCWCYRLGSHRR